MVPISLLMALCSTAAPGTNGLPQADQPLDLPAAVELALSRNLDLARTAQSVRGQRIGVAAAKADFAPRLRPDTYATVTDANSSWQYGVAAARKLRWGTDVELGVRAGGVDDDETDGTRKAALRVGLHQPLFRNFGSLVNLEGVADATSALKAARRSYEQQKADLIVQVAESFETVIRLERQINFDRQAVARMERVLRLTRAREKQGRSTRVDTLRVELQKGQAEGRLASSREALSSAQSDFAELLGFRPEIDFKLVPPPLLELEAPAVEVATAIAFSNRMDYAQALQDYEDSGRNVRIARRRRYPDIVLTGLFERQGEGERFSDASKLDENAWTVGLTVGSEFSPLADRVALDRAETDRVGVGQNIRILELAIARQVQQQLIAYRRAQNDRVIAERNARLAASRARLARRLFDIGRGDSFAVTDAEDALIQADIEDRSARSNASISAYRLLRTLGTLVEHPADLRPPPLEEGSLTP